jgi:hypothetical protein
MINYVSHLRSRNSPPSSADVKNAWSYTSTPQYVFMAWCLVKQRDNFTFYLYLRSRSPKIISPLPHACYDYRPSILPSFHHCIETGSRYSEPSILLLFHLSLVQILLSPCSHTLSGLDSNFQIYKRSEIKLQFSVFSALGSRREDKR